MKKSTLLGAILISSAFYAQEFTSFEEPELFTGLYTDTGDQNVAHDLLNNQDEPLVNYISTGNELGFDARYEPYVTPGIGLTDGDDVGVTDSAPTGSDPFTDGVHGYQISDVDGNFILEIEPVLSSTSLTFSIDFFVSETGYEGDGTINESGSDRFRIYIFDIDNGLEAGDIINTTGTDINDVLIGGDPIEVRWINSSFTLEDLVPGILFQLVIEVRCNSVAEAFFFDNIVIDGILGIEDHNGDFYLFPNPVTKDFVNIISKFEGDKSIVVFDVLGKQIINTTIAHNKLDVSMLNSGVYIVKIKQGTESVTKKLVIR